MFILLQTFGLYHLLFFDRSSLQMKLEEVTRRAQEQLQIVLEEQSRLEKFNVDLSLPLSLRSELDHLVVTKARCCLHGTKTISL